MSTETLPQAGSAYSRVTAGGGLFARPKVAGRVAVAGSLSLLLPLAIVVLWTLASSFNGFRR